MLWIGSGRDSTLTEEVARYSRLEVSFALANSQEWRRKDFERFRLIVLDLPACSDFVQEILAAAQKTIRPLPVLILDRERSLDESLIGPAFGLFQHLLGERTAEEIAAGVSAALQSASQKGSLESQESWNRLLVGESQPMRELRAIIRLAGPRQSTVLARQVRAKNAWRKPSIWPAAARVRLWWRSTAAHCRNTLSKRSYSGIPRAHLPAL